MKPVLDIGGPAIQKLAESALFGQIQEAFNLRPASMAKAFNLLARKKSVAPLQLVPPIQDKVNGLLFICLDEMVAVVEGRRIVLYGSLDKEIRDLQSHFNLDSIELAKGINAKANREGMSIGDTHELAHWLQKNAPLVFDWAFAQTEYILRNEAELEDE